MTTVENCLKHNFFIYLIFFITTKHDMLFFKTICSEIFFKNENKKVLCRNKNKMLPHNNRKYMVYNNQYRDQIGQYEHYKPPPSTVPIIYTLYIDGKVKEENKNKKRKWGEWLENHREHI